MLSPVPVVRIRVTRRGWLRTVRSLLRPTHIQHAVVIRHHHDDLVSSSCFFSGNFGATEVDFKIPRFLGFLKIKKI